MRAIHTPDAPQPAGHYAQAIVHAGTVYVSGQLPLDPATGQLVAGDVARQTEQTLQNVDAILRAAGSGLSHVLSMTIYVTERSQWAAVNAVYARRMGAHRPARAVIPVKELREGCYVEIQAVAALPGAG